ncbi:MAG: ABC transporter ATP-binding protein [Tissierellia bacterium]|nr:ABC transporter ATP-binding protein [Tissierellia bacterium]
MNLKIEGISKKFQQKYVLDNINIEIEDGEFIAILGPSGCGKTTLLRIIGGFVEPTFGELYFEERLYSSNSYMHPVEDRNLNMVFQSFALWPHMTVREHIEYPLRSKNHKDISKEEKSIMVRDALKEMNLEGLEERLPSQLSGGQKQRVSLARAIVGKPGLLLMDEPLSALDAELRVEMRQVIKHVHSFTKTTIIYVTHDQSEALAMADRIVVMNKGRIEQIGTPNEVYNNPKTRFVAEFVSKANLLRGKWNGDSFVINGTQIILDGLNINQNFKREGIYPVRPEDIKISKDSNGVCGEIMNAEFHGNQLQYTIKTDIGELTVVSFTEKCYQIGAKVYLHI